MLSIVATPIGNLGDITLRALETLRTCDGIVCEDTRVTGKLLSLLDLPQKELVSLHSFSNPKKLEEILGRLQRGQHLALVSDAGTPGISDPGYALVSRARAAGMAMEVVPGPSALLAALSASGLPIHHFLYLGFLPLKKGRTALLRSLREETRTVVFYESVHRIERTFRELAEALRDQSKRPVVICRELTKMHEEIVSTTIGNLPSAAATFTKRGEFVVVLGPSTRPTSASRRSGGRPRT